MKNQSTHEAKMFKLTATILMCGCIFSAASAKPPENKAVLPSAGGLVTPIDPATRRAILGPCRADLSVESISLLKTGPTGPINISMVYKNVGTEAFDAPPRFTGAVIDTTSGATNLTTSHPASDIAVVRPNQSRRVSLTMPRTVFDTFEFAGEVRAWINFGPDAPRCGMDSNRSNDELRVSNRQVRDWLGGTALQVEIRR
jgi:hypothetical protein